MSAIIAQSVGGMMLGVSRPAARDFAPHSSASTASPVASMKALARR